MPSISVPGSYFVGEILSAISDKLYDSTLSRDSERTEYFSPCAFSSCAGGGGGGNVGGGGKQLSNVL